MGVHNTFASSGLTYLDGKWLEGNVPLMGSMTHAAWLASAVFDGARSIKGLAPDLDMHCERCIDSALKFDLRPPVTAEEMGLRARRALRHAITRRRWAKVNQEAPA